LIGSGYTLIAAGQYHSLALKGSALYTWGQNNHGQLGDRSTIDRNIPTLIGTGFTAIAADGTHSLALKGSALYAWGYNAFGQLGDGSKTDRYIPTLIGTGFTAIEAGGTHSLALKGNALYVWGTSTNGQLGDGTKSMRKYPIMIGKGYTAIAGGYYHSLAIRNGKLYAWGGNSEGQLGDGTAETRLTPTLVASPAPAALDPLYISSFTVNKRSLNIGDKVVFTVKTGTSVKTVSLYRDGMPFASTISSKKANGARTWTFSFNAAEAGTFQYWAVASDGDGDGVASPDIYVNVSASNLEVKGFTISKPVVNVGQTVTIKVTTSKIATRVRIVDDENRTVFSSSKPSKTTSTRKVWTIKRKVTERDLGNYVLRAEVDTKYGSGPASEPLDLLLTDSVPRVISVKVENGTAKVRRGREMVIIVETNAAATSVRISNDRNEKWVQTDAADSRPSENRQTWRVTVRPRQLGVRKFYAQAWRGKQSGAKKYARKIYVNK